MLAIDVLGNPCVVFPESGKNGFGRLAGLKSWFEDCGSNPNVEELATSFTSDVAQLTNLRFPIKYVKCHPTDKPWITPQIKQLIKERQTAFHSGNAAVWRHFWFKVKVEIEKSKRRIYADKVCHLKNSNSRKWWNVLNKMTGRKTKSECVSSLQVDGKTLTGSELMTPLNEYCVSVNADISPLDLSSLPAFLPALNDIPYIQPYEVCQKLLSLKTNKAAGPDNLSARILREFAYELAVPITKRFNLSLSTGSVPSVWKDSNIIPVPKVSKPLGEGDTRPISLTPILAKVLEDFVVNWILDDIGPIIDTKQFGSLKGSSTTYCLLDLLSITGCRLLMNP